MDSRSGASLPGIDGRSVTPRLDRELRCRRGHDIEGGVFTKCLEGLNLLVEGAFAAARMNVEKVLEFLVGLLSKGYGSHEKRARMLS